MNDALTERLSARLTSAERQQVEDVAAAQGIRPSEAMRLALGLLIERHRAESAVPREMCRSEREVLQARRRDIEAFCSVGDPILEKQGLVSRDHRRAVMIEITEDASLIATTAQALSLGVDVTEMLTAVFDDFFERHPCADIVWSIPERDLIWLELRRGEVPSIREDHCTCVASAVQRADVLTRWRWARRVLLRMANEGTDVRDLFSYCNNWHGWRLKDRAQLRSFSKGGALHWEVGEPNNDVAPAPVMNEIEALAAGIRSAKIGTNTERPRIRQNQIDGNVPPSPETPLPHAASVGHRSSKIGRVGEQPPLVPPRDPVITEREGVSNGTRSPQIGADTETVPARRNTVGDGSFIP